MPTTNDPPIEITEAESRIPVRLAESVDKAKREGTTVRIQFAADTQLSAEAQGNAQRLVDEMLQGETRHAFADLPHHISAEDAMDSQKYQRAKTAASAAGQRLIIDPQAAARSSAFDSKTMLRISKADALDTAKYRAAKAQAEKAGKSLFIGE